MSAHVQLFIHQYPQVLLGRAALNPFIPQPVLIPGLAATQVQDLALDLVEPHEVHVGPLLELVQLPLDGIPSLRRAVNCTTQLGVACKLAVVTPSAKATGLVGQPIPTTCSLEASFCMSNNLRDYFFCFID